MRHHPIQSKWPILILLLGAALRFHALSQDARFHPDEALFATFARNAAVNGDWLLLGPLDKTPLSIYASAISMMFVGNTVLPDGVLNLEAHRGEFAARLPSTFASIVLAALVYGLAKRFYHAQTTALIALFLIAVSPYAVAFSATAFTDGLMLLFVVLALWAASRNRWWGAGVWLALGFASKQQALLYIPLVISIGWFTANQSAPSIMRLYRLLKLILPLLICLILLALWDSARAQPTGFWALAVANNDPGRLIQADEAIPRLLKWLRLGAVIAGSAWLTGTLLLLAVIGFIHHFIYHRRDTALRADTIFILYSLSYGLLHWLIAFNIYDRYVLPLLPLIVLLMARGIEWLWNNLRQGRVKIACASIMAVGCGFMIISGWRASEGQVSVGADRGQHMGVDELADYLNSKTLGAIVYDHWLGWELGYYMGPWTNKRRVYYPTPTALTADALLQDDPAPRYFVVPADQSTDKWLGSLRKAGFGVTLDYQITLFRVYRLIPPRSRTRFT